MKDLHAVGRKLGQVWFEDFQAEFLVAHASLINPKFLPKNYIKQGNKAPEALTFGTILKHLYSLVEDQQ